MKEKVQPCSCLRAVKLRKLEKESDFFFVKFQVVANLGERKRGRERCEFFFFKSKLKKQILPKKSYITFSIMKILAVESIRKRNLNSVHGKFEILDLRDKLYT